MKTLKGILPALTGFGGSLTLGLVKGIMIYRKLPMVLTVLGFLLGVGPEISLAQTWQPTSAPISFWFSVACSADGQKIIAGASIEAYLYASTNFGQSWVQLPAPSQRWFSVASSADGSRFIAANYTEKSIYTSGDAGATWHSNSLPALDDWMQVTSSSDGRVLMVVSYNSAFVSRDYGATWTSNSLPESSSLSREAVSSADGSKLVIGSTSHLIYVSTNSGVTWQQATNAPNFSWISMAMSADGSKLMGLVQLPPPNGQTNIVFTSTNLGQTWATNFPPPISWTSVAMSADGGKCFLGTFSSNCISTDGGQTWLPGPAGSHGAQIVASADGSRLFSVDHALIAANQNYIYTSYTPASPVLKAVGGTNMTLSWQVPSTNFIVQQSSDLAAWVSLTNSPVLSFTNLQNQVSLPQTNTRGFFRLATP